MIVSKKKYEEDVQRIKNTAEYRNNDEEERDTLEYIREKKEIL